MKSPYRTSKHKIELRQQINNRKAQHAKAIDLESALKAKVQGAGIDRPDATLSNNKA